MKTRIKKIAALLIGFMIYPILGYGQNHFPIGIVNFGSNIQYASQVLTQMDSTNATWVQMLGQNSGTADDVSINNTVLQNTQGLNVIAIRLWNIVLPAKSQRMEFQAEQSIDPSKNYFQTRTVGSQPLGENAWKATAPGTAGFMAKDVVPDNEYHLLRSNYVATFILKIIASGVPSKQVATLSIVDDSTGNTLASRVLTEADFPNANYQSLELAYTLPQPPALPAKSFGKLLANATGVANNHNIDVRVYWHGLVTTWLDQVWIEDTMPQPPPNPESNFNPWGAYQIFPRFGQIVGPRDNIIIGDADDFQSAGTYPLLQRFYLADEPLTNGFLPYRYVDDLLQQANPDNLAQGRGRGVTAYYYHQRAQRFLNDSQARELFLDHYPIYANIPSPSILDDNKAAANGIAIYTDSPTYNTALEAQITSLNDAATAAKNSSRTLWFIAQTQGILCEASGRYDTLSTKFLRPPTPNELRVMTNLALAYGAKGIFYYPYGSDSYFPAGFNGCKTAQNIGLVSSQPPVNNYPKHNTNEETLSGHLVYAGYQEKWNAVQSINADLVTLGPVFVNLKWKSAFTSGNPPNETAPAGSVVASITGGEYVEAANFDSTGFDSFIMLVNRKCDLNDVQTVTVNTNKTGNWILDDQLTHELYVSSNGVFKEIKLNPGQGRLFRVRAMTANENWSGAINISNGITIANGSTLTIQLGSTVKFSSGASLMVDGKLIADSNDPAKRIAFTGTTATPGFWNGITINSGNSANNSTLRRCDVQYATTGITINYTDNTNNVTIDKCKVQNNSSHGIYVAGNGSGAIAHPTIINNTIANNGNDGIYLTNYAQPPITGNRIENNGYAGIETTSNNSATITYNYIAGNLDFGARFTFSSSAFFHRNTVKSNFGNGVYCGSTSNLTANGADTDTTKGRNEIAGNSGAGIYASSSSPDFGQDVSSQYGNNWIHDNTGYEAQQTGAVYSVSAKRCYWSGQQGNISGNVLTSPVLSSQPSPVGWGKITGYDPTLRIQRGDEDNPAILLPLADLSFIMQKSSAPLQVSAMGNGVTNWSGDLQAAIDEGRKTGDWSAASSLITGLHRELQNARVPNVDFALVNTYANDLTVTPFIRKMLALVLMEKDLNGGNVAGALAKATNFSRNNAVFNGAGSMNVDILFRIS